MKNKIKKTYRKYEEIINYLIIGGLTTIIYLISYYVCVYTILDPKVALELQLANIISWICSVVFAYFTNRKFVFKSKNKNKVKEMISFTSSRVITLLMDMALMYLIVTVLKENDKIAKLIVQVVVIIGNYIISKLFVFKKELKNN